MLKFDLVGDDTLVTKMGHNFSIIHDIKKMTIHSHQLQQNSRLVYVSTIYQ